MRFFCEKKTTKVTIAELMGDVKSFRGNSQHKFLSENKIDRGHYVFFCLFLRYHFSFRINSVLALIFGSQVLSGSQSYNIRERYLRYKSENSWQGFFSVVWDNAQVKYMVLHDFCSCKINLDKALPFSCC